MADFPDSILVTEIPRQIVEAEIEMLIDLLDQLDANPDLEDGADIENDTADDEPFHGSPEHQAGSWRGIDASVGLGDGEEVELGWTELEARFGRYRGGGDNGYEPSLGSNGGINQLKWSKCATNDREDEHDGRGDCCEDEGAQCDDEGAIEQDTGNSEDDMVGYHYFSQDERNAIEEVAQKMRALAGTKQSAPRVVTSMHGRRGVVRRIY